MTEWNMFAEIKRYRKIGLKKSQIARKLEINIRTVNKYWDMSYEEYSKLTIKAKERIKKLDNYQEIILDWIRKYRDVSAAQIADWLVENKYIENPRERTVRLYVNALRKKYNLPKIKDYRQYEEVPELPMGYQAQIDIGEIILNREDGSKVKVFCFGLVLSHSRYKFLLWLDKRFTTQSFIEAHEKAFEYLGGMPVELVYDQDRLLAVDENFGDIIYTELFQNFKDTIGFNVRLCRGYDPESKGKIEAVVKYAKYNFARYRTFYDIDRLNCESFKWLERTGNRKVHEVTKKVPAEVFELEKIHLRKVEKAFTKKDIEINLLYPVRKTNVVLYRQNRYQMPKGTYYPGKNVLLVINDGEISFCDTSSNKVIVKHKMSREKGKLIKIKHVERNIKGSISELYEKTLLTIGNNDNAKMFLKHIKDEKGRYIRDQLGLILKVHKKYTQKDIEKALEYCVSKNLWSAVMLRDTLEYLNKEQDTKIINRIAVNSIPSKYRGIVTQLRDISQYSEALKEEKNKWKI